jgi:NTE family protein
VPTSDDPELLGLVMQLPLFADLTPELAALVAARARRRTVSRGDILCRTGEPGNEFFVIVRGAVHISSVGERGEERVAELGAGEWFGEMALITGEPRSATAVAARDTTLLVLARADLQALLARDPALALALGHALSRRLRAYLLRRAPAARPGVIVALSGGPTTNGGPLFANLATVLASESGALTVLDRAAGTPLAGPGLTWLPDPGGTLAALRAAHPLLLVHVAITDPRAPALLAEADAVWALDGAASGAPVSAWAAEQVPGALPTSIRASGVGRADGAVFVDPAVLAAPCLDRGAPGMHALRRMARTVLRRRVGLVLSAGGAKGLAHVGALRCFERAGLEFDLVAGSSMGGIVGALLAMGRDSADMLRTFRGLAGNLRRSLLDFGLPEVALLHGDRKRDAIRAEVGERDVRDLPLPFWAVAADLVSGREVVLGSGPLWRALDATSAIPTVFPPVVVGEHVLVDGWVVNPLPADVLRREGADIVIAVDTSAGVDPTMRLDTGGGTTGVLGLISGLFDRLANPAIVRIALRAMEVGGRERTLANLALVDAAVQPDLGAFSVADARQLDEIVARGEEAAEAALPAIRTVMRGGHPGRAD